MSDTEFQNAYNNDVNEQMAHSLIRGLNNVPMNINARNALLNRLKPLFVSLESLFIFDIEDAGQMASHQNNFRSLFEHVLQGENELDAIEKIISDMIRAAPGDENQALREALVDTLSDVKFEVEQKNKKKPPSSAMTTSDENLIHVNFPEKSDQTKLDSILRDISTEMDKGANELRMRILIARAYNYPDFNTKQRETLAKLIITRLKRENDNPYNEQIQNRLAGYVQKKANISIPENASALSKRTPSPAKPTSDEELFREFFPEQFALNKLENILSDISTEMDKGAKEIKMRILINNVFQYPHFNAEQREILADLIVARLKRDKNNPYTERVQNRLASYAQNKAKVTKPENAPALSVRTPGKLKAKDMVVTSSGREVTLIDKHALIEFKKLQFWASQSGLHTQNGTHPTSGFYSTAPDGSPLKHPVFIGQNGEIIAITAAKLGEGGYGKVFIGMDVDTGNFVAVKQQTAHVDLNPIDNIQAEQNTMEALHRLVAKLQEGDTVYTVDELGWGADYSDVNEKLKAQTTDPQAQMIYKLDMAIKLFGKINALHEQGYIHRDIKLDNALWDDKTKRAHLIDFGMTKQKSLMHNEGMMGTPMYMAPEVRFGEYSEKSDVYACGVAAIELFSQFDIFNLLDEWREAIKNSDLETLENIFSACIEKIEETEDEELRAICGCIRGMVDINPESRPNLADAIATLSQLKAKIEYDSFTARCTTNSPIVASPEELKNYKILSFLQGNIRKDPNYIQRIEPGSLYPILKQTAQDNRSALFEPVAKQFDLFSTQNTAFHTVIVKTMLESIINDNKKTQTFDKYLKMALTLPIDAQTRVLQILKDQATVYQQNPAILALLQKNESFKNLQRNVETVSVPTTYTTEAKREKTIASQNPLLLSKPLSLRETKAPSQTAQNMFTIDAPKKNTLKL